VRVKAVAGVGSPARGTHRAPTPPQCRPAEATKKNAESEARLSTAPTHIPEEELRQDKIEGGDKREPTLISLGGCGGMRKTDGTDLVWLEPVVVVKEQHGVL
jgi:hypothetical protein